MYQVEMDIPLLIQFVLGYTKPKWIYHYFHYAWLYQVNLLCALIYQGEMKQSRNGYTIVDIMTCAWIYQVEMDKPLFYHAWVYQVNTVCAWICQGEMDIPSLRYAWIYQVGMDIPSM